MYSLRSTASCRHTCSIPPGRRRVAVFAVLSTPLETQNRKRTTREALQSARTITAVKTPYLENGRIDLESYDRLLERQYLEGIEGVIVGGTTGEGQV
jgi:4-hydroxy-tetrahydrodipicolinate synthase